MFLFAPFYIFVYFQTLILAVGLAIQATISPLFRAGYAQWVFEEGEMLEMLVCLYGVSIMAVIALYWILAGVACLSRKSYGNLRMFVLFVLAVQLLRAVSAITIICLSFDYWYIACGAAYGRMSFIS